jgi:spoIIIJ-associated protein
MNDEEYEFSGKTVEEALQKAERDLGLGRDEFETEVISEGRGGILGIGGEDAVIRVLVSDADEAGVALPGNSISVTATAGVEVLSRLLDLLGLEGDVYSDESGESLILNVEGDDLGVLIGRRGSTLASLQHVARLMVASRSTEWPAFTVDVCGYKQRRHAALKELARRLGEQAKYRKRPVTLEPMPPDERRVIHLALADNRDVYTESIGEEGDRKVVIHPRTLK